MFSLPVLSKQFLSSYRKETCPYKVNLVLMKCNKSPNFRQEIHKIGYSNC